MRLVRAVRAGGGKVQLIHEGSTDQSLTQDSGNLFRVRWEGGAYPSASGGTCGASQQGCTAVGTESCICEVVVNTSAVFTGDVTGE